MKLKFSKDNKLKHLILKGRFPLGALLLMIVLIAPISFVQPAVAASPQASYAPPGLSCVDFSTIAVGSSVEGLDTVHPDLAINTSSGSAVAVAEGVFPSAYGGPNGTNSIPNGGMGILQGFYDKSRVHDYVFTFRPGKTVNVFSIKSLDFGDLNAPRATEHEMSLVAYDSLGNVLDTHTLAFTSDGLGFPRDGSAGDLWITGDASAEEGQPGNFTFTVSGNDISRVEMHYNSNSDTPELPTDPYFGLTLLCFEEVVPPASLCADFATLEPDTSVEGLGTIHPDLEIRTGSGSAVAVHEGVTPGAYGGPNGGGSIPNVGMGVLQGFYDKSRIHDYVFTFGPNQSVSVFTLKMLDFGIRELPGARPGSGEP